MALGFKLSQSTPLHTLELPSIDICLVACRRPQLLKETLQSFSENLLHQMNIGKVYVNLDPFMGNQADEEEAIRVIKRFFPSAIIFTPEQPDFCAAVKRVWGSSSASIVLHLEDDWRLEQRVNPNALLSKLQGRTKAVSFLAELHGARGSAKFSEARARKKIFGITYRRYTEARFNTSPTLFDGKFLRKIAMSLDILRDPEKQLRQDGGNPCLHDFCQLYKCVFFKTDAGGPIITDIGREWRDLRGIEKILEDGQSYWTLKGRIDEQNERS